jgi:ABC-type glycerol-3-phosphate transport system substrate-binding protein
LGTLLIAVAWLVTLLVSPIARPVGAAQLPVPAAYPRPQEVTVDREPRYAVVREQYRGRGFQPTNGIDIAIPGGAFSARAPEGTVQVVDGFQGHPGLTLLWPEDVPWVEWTVDVPTSGLYQILLDYYPLPGKRASIQRGLQINGQYPFLEAKRLVFYRVWRDAAPPKQDRDGNDLRPAQVEAPRWQTVGLSDGEGWYAQPFEFYLSRGAQRLRLITIREPIAIGAIRLVSPVVVPTYEEVQAQYRQRGLRAAAGKTAMVFQAEAPSSKSDPTIRAEVGFDPLDEPAANGRNRLNEFGGWRWRNGGRWIEWTIEVPADGLYQLGFRAWQGFDNSLPVFRKIEIDGRVPFHEFLDVPFPFDQQWQLFRPSTPSGEPYLVFLAKGRHTLRLTPEIGPLRDTLWAIDDTTQEMSNLAREVTLITGPDPDPYRQWDLAERIPDLVPRLQRMADRLDAETRRLEAIAGYRPNAASTLAIASDQLRSLARDPDSMPRRLGDFLGTETSLGYWLLGLRNQPLVLDYIWVAEPSAPPPRARATVIEAAWAAIQNFVASFHRDYTGVGTSYHAGDGLGPVLTVWVGRGREWGEIMKEMIEDDFTPRTGIRVNLQVFPPGQLGAGGLNVLLLAASSGQAPDVATGVDANLPVEFAIRGAIVDLSRFPDYPQVSERFRPGALRPYQYRNGIFALPETQDFTMLFYRTDILQQLGLNPPQTWQDVYDMIWVLQQNGMDFYLPPVGQGTGGVAQAAAPGFTPFLFQHGGDYYTPDGQRSALDTPQALAAFQEWTGLYTNYKVPISADFFNRMRTGEMPIGIANYWTYVLLSTAAPELTGRWAMEPIPGIRQPDGTIDRSTGGAGAAIVMFQNSRLKQEAWEFMKWWMDADTQVRFGTELEALLGVEARWNTANVEALKRLPWPKHDIDAILEQWKWFKQEPVVPGGYFTDRHIVNAWNRVVLQGANVRDAVDLAVRDINRELRRKQEEFAAEGVRT